MMNLIDFLNASPVNYLAVNTIAGVLEDAGFRHVDVRGEMPALKTGDKVYFTKNDSSIYAMHIGQLPMQDGVHMVCAHCDSPTFRIKPNAGIRCEGGLVKLNTELYGGALMQTWFDRPLSLAGRVIIAGDDPMQPETRLLHIKRPLLQIPNLAIHFNREANDGVKLSKQKDMLPILGIITEEMEKDNVLMNLVAGELKVNAGDILDFDLYLYDTTPACTFGLNQEFVSAGRLDDLSMVHAGLSALVDTAGTTPQHTRILAIFDNEETGSMTKQGAGSPFLLFVLQRIMVANGFAGEEAFRAIENSFMISADNAHAYHPNYAEKYDPTTHPQLGGGPVIKFNASQKYATDARGAAVFQRICDMAGVPCQRFVNHSDVAGGSTLGNILAASIPVNGVDMGNPILGMHSIRETGSVKDHEYCIRAFSKFYEL
ncbi:MAG: M18 family aminopeptidase [Bacteroidaceae bacterium]|jgi:aspartyl aminopeptidase|nr:M18 family aminopeptidase [Bacteroidaceae bacterium]